MNLDELSQIEALFQAAADLTPPERAELLDRESNTDGSIRSRVEVLLQQFDRGEPLEPPSLAQMSAAADGPGDEYAGTQIGPYKLLEHIGEGGFGSVYLADQTEPVRRRVAVKIIKQGMDTKQVIARFEAERQALAMMEHPHIARVLDAGATETGRPYFVMELVRGDPVTEYCDRQSLSATERLKLFQQICGAVQHAHTKGVIHRDLKPTNILVTVADGKPVPKVIDFGIAKATSGRLTDKTLYTEMRQLLGTPAYMSPEQADASAVDIDTRSDIYALGVLLYELLTGTTPFDAARLRSMGCEEVRRIIREEEPEKPSTRMSTLQRHAVSGDGGPRAKGARTGGSSGGIAAPFGPGDVGGGSSAFDVAEHRKTDPASLTRLLRGDLDWIVMKCLDKERSRRYETANGLAIDIQRHLDHEPVRAGPPGAAYRFRKFARRNRVSLVAGCTVVISLVIGLALAAVGFVEATQERERAEALAAQRDDQRGRAEANFQLARDAVDSMLTRVAEELADQPHMEATRKALLEDALAFYEGFLDEYSEDPAVRSEMGRAYRRIGEINEMLGQDPSFMFLRDAMVHRQGPTQWSSGELRRMFRTTVVPQPRHRTAGAAYTSSIALHQRLVSEAPELPGYRADLVESYMALGYSFWRSGRPLEAVEPIEHAVRIGEVLVAEFPTSAGYRATLGRSLNGLGLVREDPRRGEEALRQAVALYEQLITDSPDEPEHVRFLATVQNNLALVLCDQGRYEEEDKAFEDAIQLGERLVAAVPDNPDHRAFLALLLENFASHHVGQLEEAEQALVRSLALREALAADFPTVPGYRQSLTRGYFQLASINAVAAAQKSRLAEAADRREAVRAANTRAVEIQEGLVDDFPHESSFRAQLGLAFRLMGLGMEETGDVAAAAGVYLQAVEVYSAPMRESARNAQYIEGLGIAYSLLFNALQKSEQHAALGDSLNRATDAFEAILAENPDDERTRAALGLAYGLLGQWFEVAGDLEEAEAFHRIAIELYAKLVEEFRGNAAYLQGAGTSHSRLSFVLDRQGRIEDAVTAAQMAVNIQEELMAAAPPECGEHPWIAAPYVALARALPADRYSEVIDAYRGARDELRKFVANCPEDRFYRRELTTIYNSLGLALLENAQFAEAAETYHDALEFGAQLLADDPDSIEYNGFGSSLDRLIQLRRKVEQPASVAADDHYFVKLVERLAVDHPAIDFRGSLSLAYRALGEDLESAGDLEGAEAAIRRAVKIDTELVTEAPEYSGAVEGLARSRILLDRIIGSTQKEVNAQHTLGQEIVQPNESVSVSAPQDGWCAISDLEAFFVGGRWIFQRPTYSGHSGIHLKPLPNLANVTDEVPGWEGKKACEVRWEWVDSVASRWVRLTTHLLGNPTIDLRMPMRVRLRLDSGSLRVCVGIRETGVDAPVGSDGGVRGRIEWLGADSKYDFAPQGRLVTAKPGEWQTITFDPRTSNVTAFTGDGVLETETGKGVLEHLAFTIVDTPGPFTVYIDAIEQQCAPVDSIESVDIQDNHADTSGFK